MIFPIKFQPCFEQPDLSFNKMKYLYLCMIKGTSSGIAQIEFTGMKIGIEINKRES